MRTTKLMAGALTLLVLVGGAAAAETVQSSESTVYTLPANVSRIEEYAFYGDGELREIRIPEPSRRGGKMPGDDFPWLQAKCRGSSLKLLRRLLRQH